MSALKIDGFSAAYLDESRNFLSTMSEADLDDSGPEYQRLFGYALALRSAAHQSAGRIRVLEAALVHAVSVIQTWHNADVPESQRSELWDIYWRNSPEMKPIREALKEQP
jgi:hypothetical protein